MPERTQFDGWKAFWAVNARLLISRATQAHWAAAYGLRPPSPSPSSRRRRRSPRGRADPFAPQLCCAGICREGGRLLSRSTRRRRMPLGLTLGSLGRAMRRKRLSSLDILSSKRAPRDYYKGKNCKPTGFHTRKGTIFPPTSPAFQVRALSFGLRQFVPFLLARSRFGDH